MEEIIKYIATGLGAGGLATIATAWIASRRASNSEGTEGWRTAVQAQKDAAEAFERIVEDARQEIDALTKQAHQANQGHEECLRLVRKVQEEHAPCPGRITTLETKLSAAADEIKELRESIG